VTQNKIISKGSSFIFSFYTYYAPPSIGIHPAMSLSVFKNNYLKMIGSFTLTAVQNTLTNIEMSLSNAIIATVSQYLIKFTSINSINSKGMIIINFPLEISINACFSQISTITINGTLVLFTSISPL
jgi:hypothetical protein